MDDFLVEDSAVDGLSPWCLVTFSSGSLSPDFICLLSTVTSRAVIDIPIAVASRVVVTLPSAVASGFICFLSTVAFLLEDSVSQWFDTRYFTFSPAKSSTECLLSLYQNGCYSQQSRIYFPTQWLIGLISQYFIHLSPAFVCRAVVVAVLPVEPPSIPGMVG